MLLGEVVVCKTGRPVSFIGLGYDLALVSL